MSAFKLCSAFSLDSVYENSTFNLFRDVYCPNTNCSGKLCLHNKTFKSIGRSYYQCPQCASVCQVRNFLSEDRTNSIFFRLAKGFTFLKRVQNQFKMFLVNGDAYCPGKSCSNRKKCKSLGGYVTTPKYNYGCGKCGGWLFVHKVRVDTPLVNTVNQNFIYILILYTFSVH